MSNIDELAVNGGPKTAPDGVTTRRLFGQEEKDAVCEFMDRAIQDSSVFKYSGPEEDAYAAAFCEMLGGGFADGVNSGTNAVYVAVAATDPPAMSEIIVPPVSDAGGAMPVAMLGCVPVAADAAPGSYNTCAEEIAKVITDRTHAILVAHIAGIPCDMEPILALARERNLFVIEDCAQAHGATCGGKPVGTLGDTAAFSTMFGKHHASGGQGGLFYTQNEEMYWRGRRMADRGKPFGLEAGHTNVRASLNCNMDELHAVIGRTNLAKLPGFVARRREIFSRVNQAMTEQAKAVRLVTGRQQDEPSWWFMVFRLEQGVLSVGKDEFVKALVAEGMPATAGYPFFPMRMEWATERCCVCGSAEPCERHNCPRSNYATPELPNALAANEQLFRITIHEGWSDQDIDHCIEALLKVERAYLA